MPRRREQLDGLARELGEIGLPDPEASWLDGEGLGVLIEAIEMAVLPEQAEAMLDELLESSKELLPQFRPARAV